MTTDRILGISTSVAIKPPCKSVTTTAITQSGEQTIGSVALVDGDRYLYALSPANVLNGIWVVRTGAHERAKDFDGNRDVVTGTLVLVKPGTAQTRVYEMVTAGAIHPGTTAIEFEEHVFETFMAPYEAQVETVAIAAGASLGTFTTLTYTPGTNSLFLFANGIGILEVVTDYTETGASSFTLTSPAAVALSIAAISGRLVTSGVDAGQVSVANSDGSAAALDAIMAPNFLQFGGDPTGVADSSQAFIDFCTHLKANNLIGEGPSGTYKFSSAVSITPGSNWGLKFPSSETTVFLYSGASTTNDIWTIGDNAAAQCINVNWSGITFRSSTTMTAGIGVRLKSFCRSNLKDVVIDGQDGTGKLWHGVRFDGLDNVFWSDFQARAQKDGVQINGLVSGAKAGLFLNHFKIGGNDVGVRVGGAFGGLYFGTGDIIGNGDGLVIDNTLVAEVNREVQLSATMSIDSCTRCGLVVDQSTSSQFFLNIPARTWIASTTSHGIWIKNANGAKIPINAYLYNIGGDGIRIDDVNAFIDIDNGIFSAITGYGINPTVVSTNITVGAPRFYGVSTPTNETNTKLPTFVGPLRIQNGPPFTTHLYTGTLDGSGTATIAHGMGGTWYTQVMSVSASHKTAANAWAQNPATDAYVDGTNIGIDFGAPAAALKYQVFIIAATSAHSGW